ncbi:MAG: thioredoxin family protein [Candidatus Aminicenantes bacterium]|nr:thioredoxin family protein [Candidatus Aminicenantes bacterium]
MKKFLFTLFILMVAVTFAADRVDRAQILKDEGWKQIYITYEPDSSFIDILKSKVGDNLKIDVYLAFWCGDSKRNVPLFLKIIDQISSGVKVNYYSVERKPTKDTKYFVEKLEVERVPTFIFYRDDKEIGRIIENPKSNMLEDFLEIVF